MMDHNNEGDRSHIEEMGMQGEQRSPKDGFASHTRVRATDGGWLGERAQYLVGDRRGVRRCSQYADL